MRKLQADYIFPIASEPVPNGVLMLDDDGVVLDVLNPANQEVNTTDVEQFKGFITPGFVNSHCHLELSWMKGLIQENRGLDQFIADIAKLSVKPDPKLIHDAIVSAENEMLSEGIVACGDISNHKHSFSLKQKKNLFYHTYIELFGFNPDKAEQIFQNGLLLSNELNKSLPRSLSPHAPYSLSDKLLNHINTYSSSNKNILSIHLAENEDEYAMYENGNGKVFDRLHSFGIQTDSWMSPGKSPVKYLFPKLNHAAKILFVHNTALKDSDLEFILKESKRNKIPVAFCFCPGANLYIEKRLPDYNKFLNAGAMCTIGTDSLASNTRLSVLAEIKSIQNACPELSLNILFSWATLNGAKFLDIENQFGSFEKGKTPGVILIENVNVQDQCLTNDSSVKRII